MRRASSFKWSGVRVVAFSAALCCALCVMTIANALAAVGDWPTYLASAGRSGLNGSETAINAGTAPFLHQAWTYKTNGAITVQPIEANGMVYFGSWDGNEYAVTPSTTSSTLKWKMNLGQTSDSSCTPSLVGVASSATVATVGTSTVFVGGGNGTIYALDANTGAVRWQTRLGSSPSHFIWSSPLVYTPAGAAGPSVYVGVASFGDCPLIQGQLVQMDAATGAIQNTFDTVPNGCNGASVWGAPTVDTSTGDIYFVTGNGGTCNTAEPYSTSIVEVSAKDLSFIHHWQVPTSQLIVDSDFGSTPTLFTATINGVNRLLVGATNKNGIFYAWDRTAINKGPVWQTRISVGGDCPQCGGASIASAAWDGTTIYVAGGATSMGGVSCAGGMRAFNPANGALLWQRCLQDGHVLVAATAAPGIVTVGAGPAVYVFDAGDGHTLLRYAAPSGQNFWGASSISNGMLYEGNNDGNVYAFQPPSAAGPTWYFAEGHVGSSFTEYLSLTNPNNATADVWVNYLLGNGTAFYRSYTVGANARATVNLNTVVSGVQDVSMVVQANQPIVAERPMYFTYNGSMPIPSGTDALGATALGTSYAFGYLDTSANHYTYLTILNQTSSAMTVTARYFAASGTETDHTHTVGAHSRGTIYVNGEGLAAGSYSALVQLSQPGLVERPMYLVDSVTGRTGAADVMGVSGPSATWNFAEGFTGAGFSERYVLANPGGAATHATVTFYRDNGTTTTASVSIPANGQTVVDANGVLGAGVNNSASVEADTPIVAERFMSFLYTAAVGNSNSSSIPGATDVLGTTQTGTHFVFAEGYTGGAFAEYLTVENPSSATAASLTVTFLPASGSGPVVRTYTVGAATRFTLFTGSVMGQQSFAMTVSASQPVVAERPMYFNYGPGDTGGTDVVGYQP
jgi:outer membrane protein assembly factor BamB